MKAETKWIIAAMIFMLLWTIAAASYLDRKTDHIRDALIRDFRAEAIAHGAAYWKTEAGEDKFVWRRCTIIGWRG